MNTGQAKTRAQIANEALIFAAENKGSLDAIASPSKISSSKKRKKGRKRRKKGDMKKMYR